MVDEQIISLYLIMDYLLLNKEKLQLEISVT